jgi:hypothetical protein
MFSAPVFAEQTPDDILNAIIKIRATIPEDAATARILGTEREGNGVLIDEKGHILTIGYIILEAETIEITAGPGHFCRLRLQDWVWNYQGKPAFIRKTHENGPIVFA